MREVLEETGAEIRITGLVGAYRGEPMMRTYGNGDRAGYVTVAYECRLLGAATPDMDELIELGWFERAEIGGLSRQGWIDRVIADATVA